MDLTERQKDALAEYLAERLVGFATRRATAEAAGMPDAQVAGEPVRSWRLLIDEALERGRFQQLVKTAAGQSLGDTGLETLAQGIERGVLILPEPPRPPLPWRILMIGFFGALIVVAIAFVGAQMFATWRRRSPGHLPPPAAAATTVPAGAPAPGAHHTRGEETPHLQVRQGLEPEPEPAPRHAVSTAEPAPAPEPAPASEPAAAPEYQPPPGRYVKIPEPPAPEPAPAPAPTIAKRPAPDPGACTGYAYAGNTRPDTSGGRWTPPTAVNVRAWYPRRDNGYDAKGKVVCVLPGGAPVPAGTPIQVQGGPWWIPIQGGP